MEGLIFEAMKLRMEPGSIKIRMSQEEITKLYKDKYVEEEIRLSEEAFYIFKVIIKTDIKLLKVYFYDNTLEISLPLKIAEEWKHTGNVGVKSIFQSDVGKDVEIIVEKDLGRKSNYKKQA